MTRNSSLRRMLILLGLAALLHLLPSFLSGSLTEGFIGHFSGLVLMFLAFLPVLKRGSRTQ